MYVNNDTVYSRTHILPETFGPGPVFFVSVIPDLCQKDTKSSIPINILELCEKQKYVKPKREVILFLTALQNRRGTLC
jgi:hypothetical protein